MLFIYTYKRFSGVSVAEFRQRSYSSGVPAAEVLSIHEASLCYSFTRINALVEFRQRSSGSGVPAAEFRQRSSGSGGPQHPRGVSMLFIYTYKRFSGVPAAEFRLEIFHDISILRTFIRIREKAQN